MFPYMVSVNQLLTKRNSYELFETCYYNRNETEQEFIKYIYRFIKN